jgi:hypothetical protein
MAEFLTNKYIIERINELQHSEFSKDFIGTQNDNNDIEDILAAFNRVFDNGVKVPTVDTNHTHYPLTTLYGMTYENIEEILPDIVDKILGKKNLDGSIRHVVDNKQNTTGVRKVGKQISNLLSWKGNYADEAKHNLARILYFIALDNCDGIRTDSTPVNINEMYKTKPTTDDVIQMIPIRIPSENKLRILLFYIASTIADNDTGDMDYNPVFRFYEDLFKIQNRDEVNKKDNALMITRDSIIESFNTATLTLKDGVNNSVDLRLIQSILYGSIILYKTDELTLLNRVGNRLQSITPTHPPEFKPVDETSVKKYVDSFFTTDDKVDNKINNVVQKLLDKFAIKEQQQSLVASSVEAASRV